MLEVRRKVVDIDRKLSEVRDVYVFLIRKTGFKEKVQCEASVFVLG
jgi:hypothetical protein